MKKQTFVDITEEMINSLAEDIDIYIDSVIEALMPDGRPFGMEKKTTAEELEDYMKLRGNASAWWEWMATRYDYLKSKMAEVIPEDQQALLHPWDIVYRHAMNFSSKMEKEYRRQQLKLANNPDIINTEDSIDYSIEEFGKEIDEFMEG